MGLDCSHDAFHGAYSAFNSFRQAVAWAVGGSFPPHWKRNADGSLPERQPGQLLERIEGYDDGYIYWPDELAEKSPGVMLFLQHSDCDGEFTPDECAIVANDLEPLLDKMTWESHGHIARDGGYRAVLQRFIDGCRAAHAAGEPLLFR